jgi:glyoxylase-like metal-dependent hydrolase (beta-lactamase superfamily II)
LRAWFIFAGVFVIIGLKIKGHLNDGERTDPMSEWFTIDTIDEETYIISEYRHWEETHCYLLIGAEKALLIDTGLGIDNIYDEVRKRTDKPIIAVATHIHWDHIGGHAYFPDFFAHENELNWLSGEFPLSADQIKDMVMDRCDPPEGFCIDDYEMFQGVPTRLLKDGDTIDIGGRVVGVLHTPGHSPGHMCFFEASRGYLFTGDLIYKDTLLAFYPSTDPQAYLKSVEAVAALPAKRVFPAHHSLDIHPEILLRVRDAFRGLEAEGKLHHGSGTFEYGDFSIWI